MQLLCHWSRYCPGNCCEDKWRGGGCNNYRQDVRMSVGYSFYQVYHETGSWVWKQGILWIKWCALMEMVCDRAVAWWPSTLPPKTALTSFSPHQQAQRRAVCGSLLSCCSLLLPGSLCGINISSFNKNPETWGENVSCLLPPWASWSTHVFVTQWQ